MTLSTFNRWRTYWHTIRYLKFVQIYGRAWFFLFRPKPDLSPAPKTRSAQGTWDIRVSRRQSLFGPTSFRFLNKDGCIKNLGWDNPDVAGLWRYNAHYFDDLNAIDAAERSIWHTELLSEWVDKNLPGAGIGWDPYPTSLRIVNWVKWVLSGNVLPDKCLSSLATQTRWLATKLERHLLGNHYFANAKALVFAGLMFQGPEAEGWLKNGLKIIKSQLPEQVLPDGGNFELSPMYHSIFLEDLLDLINIGRLFPNNISSAHLTEWTEISRLMLDWLNQMSHPDGQIALFNDAAINIAASPLALNTYARELNVLPIERPRRYERLSILHLDTSGYARVTGPSFVAILDLAKIGPDYLPSHAMADTLSFELSLFGQRVIVNGGTSQYGKGSERLAERQTGSHSTVLIDNESSSEVWSGFRVARRAYPFDLEIDVAPDRIAVACSHDGYHRLPNCVTHRRLWSFVGNELEITDRIRGHVTSAIATYIFHPTVTVMRIDDASFRIELSSLRRARITIVCGTATLTTARHSSEFGKTESTQCLKISALDNTVTLRISWDDDANV